MTFAWSQTSSRVDEPIAVEMMQRFLQQNEKYGADVHHIDTARIYAGGKTESVVGACLPQCQNTGKRLLVGTKAHPSQPGGLSPEGIETQLQASLQAMGDLSTIEEFYLHQPDTEHSLRESLGYTNDLVQKGVIRTVGMSNYHASEVERAFAICQEEGWAAPTVYQGLYNPLNRMVEKELLPLLKKNKCSFIAYNPLAAGLLTGKHTSLDEVQKGRFKKNQNYLPRFYTKENFAAIDLIRQACEKEGISMVEATYRWLLCHSALDVDHNDGVLLGASSLSQLDQNLNACIVAASDNGELSQSILDAFAEGWKLTEAGAFPYWRSYSSDMPNREALDQGASYSAAKK
eukprot:CAMPEP_0172452268 /NCGR_PEP_ID=MMETSP1065-20121228/9987_1 /TAXON_ID=265537 /ORGANISM="Amphiprora paludosa, Strain CCMP125" /LENGTH=345 /DNA_ID=CAMNT_0013204305 /DNA_START=7 /DNA_END=1044 /DNA_ORIENTATION=-